MKVTIWGSRGSVSTMSPETMRYGGNTTCIALETDNNDIIILDAGTGIRKLGTQLMKKYKEKTCSICFTHTHWDHMYGLTSFKPLYSEGWTVNIFGPQFGQHWEDTFNTLFKSCYFPVDWETAGKRVKINEFTPGTSFNIGSARIETFATAHPGGNSAYKIYADGWAFMFSGDHEWDSLDEEHNQAMVEFMSDVDCIIADAQYFLREYPKYKGWGHSTMERWIEQCMKTNVKKLIFTHHNPEHNDIELEQYIYSIKNNIPKLPVEIALAYEGMEITAGGKFTEIEPPQVAACPICAFSKKLSQFDDHSVILESILSEARVHGKSDAGTIYLVDDIAPDDVRLIFSYTQNESLFSTAESNKMIYINNSIPLNNSSIAGFVALNKTPLNIPDVHKLPKFVPYSYNKSFDEKTNYKTISMLTMPLISESNKTIGVIQLINSKDSKGNIQPFTYEMERILEDLSIVATKNIEQSLKDNQLVMRILETSSLRDPTETATHVMRVGSISAELYQRIAEKRKLTIEEIRSNKNNIKQAAMLHDIGKVSISDNILKKPGTFTEEERIEMQKHSYAGAHIFEQKKLAIDQLAFNVCMHHHQRWDGNGYTGHPDYPPLAGTDIPLEARIVSVADVFDALVNKRCYKDAFPIDESIQLIKEDSGKAFDPEVVEAFLDIQDLVIAIIKRYDS